MNKRAVRNVTVGCLNLILLLVLANVYWRMNAVVSSYDVDRLNLYILIMGMIFFGFGLLIEHKTVIEAFIEGPNIRWMQFAMAVLLLAVACIPYDSMNLMIINLNRLMHTSVVRYPVGIWSGVLLARSLVDTRD